MNFLARLKLSRLTGALLALAVAGCGGALAPRTGSPPMTVLNESHHSNVPKLPLPILVTFDETTGSLEFWPIRHGGDSKLQPLSKPLGIDDGYGLAANGYTIAIANYSPAEVMTYDVRTQKVKTLSDPYGGALDVAIGKDGTYYAMNLAGVTVFKHGSQPAQLTCSAIDTSEGIAVNNEGAVFINGYGPHNFIGVVEYPPGSGSCVKLHLKPESGYAAGLAVDPKTDDLIVIDNPDTCAGGLNGRMRIYSPPYEERHVVRRVLGATYCAGEVRLDATSKHIFEEDATVSAAFPIIDESRYPSAKYVGAYVDGNYSGDFFSGFTTIPNTLPN